MDGRAYEIRPELREWVEIMKKSGEEDIVVQRGLHMLYCDIKAIANPQEKGFLLSESWGFRVEASIAKELDNQILREETRRAQSPSPS